MTRAGSRTRNTRAIGHRGAHRRDPTVVLTPKCRPGDARGAEGCFERRDATLTVGATREKFALGTVVEVTGEHHRAEFETQVADEEQQRNAHRQPRGALVVDVKVGDREVRARLVGSSAKLAGNNHALDSTGSIPELARDEERHPRVVELEVLVEETCAVVLGDHVENCRAGTCRYKSWSLLARRPHVAGH